MILSVARFEYSGSKKQVELVEAFKNLCERHPELMSGWRLVLVGGSIPDNPYLQDVERAVAQCGVPVELHVNVPFDELQSYYSRAEIFWHACGLGQTDPHLIEHFGMTTVEAMLHGCIPIVINGGGQKEIVQQGLSGYRFNTIDELCERTLQVINSPELVERLREGALNRGRQFNRERFDASVKALFSAIEEEYRTVRLPDPRDILKNRRPESVFFSPSARLRSMVSSLPAAPVER
jgi:glycosyltransferase involved in cell wall biosynthesis